MRRPKLRTTSTGRRMTLQPGPLSPIPQSPAVALAKPVCNKSTGFPESFCGKGNTTLRHPEAIVSPDASISEEDISPARAVLRHRASFLHGGGHSRSASACTLDSLDMYWTTSSASSIYSMPTRTARTSTSSFFESDAGGMDITSAIGRLAICSLRVAEAPGDGDLSFSEDDGGCASGRGRSDVVHCASHRRSRSWWQRLRHGHGGERGN
ncbi:hypothetical protein VTJ04DRAFT_7964 [Mycothermus thermophilus]|uniref:uncharacterized protein n=1 Tax=Humicola insolens TaxID=85995 RepID=UPI0037438B4A